VCWLGMSILGAQVRRTETTDEKANSAVLGTYFLNEQLGTLGKLGCAICLIGSVIIVLHAPADEQIDRIDEMLNFAVQPGLSIPRPSCNSC